MGMIKKLFGLEEEIRTPKQEDVIPARCTVTSEDFDITLGYEKGKYAMLSGVRTATVPSHSAPTVQSSGLKTLDLSNGLIAGRTYHCPICGNKTRTMIREDTELRNFPLYCPKCKKETSINAQDMKVTLAEHK